MKKNQTLILTIMVFLFLNKNTIHALNISTLDPLFIHTEIVGTFVFEQFSDEVLLLRTKVEKRHFVLALKKEGECSLKDMMRVCGNKYLEENFQVEINGCKMILDQKNIIIEKDYVTFTYTIKLLNPKIEEIKVTGNYMFKYNDHAVLKVLFDLGEQTRSFKIRNRKRTIIAKF